MFISVGHMNDNVFQTVKVKYVKDWLDAHPGWVLELHVWRPTEVDGPFYIPANVDIVDGWMVWTPDYVDTAIEGLGQAQIYARKPGQAYGSVEDIFGTEIKKSISNGEEEPPELLIPYFERVLDAAAQVRISANEAESSRLAANESANAAERAAQSASESMRVSELYAGDAENSADSAKSSADAAAGSAASANRDAAKAMENANTAAGIASEMNGILGEIADLEQAATSSAKAANESAQTVRTLADQVAENTSKVLGAKSDAEKSASTAKEAQDSAVASNAAAIKSANDAQESAKIAVQAVAITTNFATKVADVANAAASSARSAEASAIAAEKSASKITDLSVQARTLEPGSQATATYNPDFGVLTIGVPAGPKGDPGDPGEGGEGGGITEVTADSIKDALGYTPADENDVVRVENELGGVKTHYAQQIELLKAVRDALKGGDIPGAIGLLDSYLLDKEVLA